MELKKTKKPIMGLAAFLIILFHFFPVSRGTLLSEFSGYFVKTAYIGVDIFFFMSGYSAYFSDTDKYFSYVKRKILNIYPMFVIAYIAFILLNDFSLEKVLFTLSGIDLFISGGAAFLWFIPAIIIFYLFIPFYKKLSEKNIKIVVAMILWLIIMLLLENIIENHSINIFLCRLPIIFIGFNLADYEGRWKNRYKFAFGLFLLIIGIFLTWKFCYSSRGNFPITDVFYVIAIPYIMGIVLLADVIFSKINFRFLNFLGGISLELYCFQMAFGVAFLKLFANYVENTFLLFVTVLALIIILSAIVWKLKVFVIARKKI